MKIGLITLHAVKNYGSVLQTLATQELFRSYGHEVEIINYIREDCLDKNLMNYWCGNNLIKRIAMYPTLKRWEKVFNRFMQKNLNLTDKVYTYEEDFEGFSLDADMYCTGSDQVWNSGWNGGIEKLLFLSFVPEDKYKFAYSASFGKTLLSKTEIEATKPYIDQYNYISVREDSAKDILEKQYGYTRCCHVVDPTLAYDGAFWRKYASASKIHGEYILIYNLNRSKEFDKYAVKLSQKTGLPLVRLCTRYDQFYRPGKSVLVPDVFEFITLIDNARYVLTDSFHATAFSLNLNTEPLCVYPAEYSSRLESVLRMTNSLQKHVMNYDDFDVVNRKIDFVEVNRALEEQRSKIRGYLEMVFRDYEVNYKRV